MSLQFIQCTTTIYTYSVQFETVFTLIQSLVQAKILDVSTVVFLLVDGQTKCRCVQRFPAVVPGLYDIYKKYMLVRMCVYANNYKGVFGVYLQSVGSCLSRTLRYASILSW